MAKFRKRPVEVEAFCWTGDFNQTEDPDWFVDALEAGTAELWKKQSGGHELVIRTLEGTRAANIGDYVIKGVKGEIYPCKPDIFKTTYELVG